MAVLEPIRIVPVKHPLLILKQPACNSQGLPPGARCGEEVLQNRRNSELDGCTEWVCGGWFGLVIGRAILRTCACVRAFKIGVGVPPISYELAVLLTVLPLHYITLAASVRAWSWSGRPHYSPPACSPSQRQRPGAPGAPDRADSASGAKARSRAAPRA